MIKYNIHEQNISRIYKKGMLIAQGQTAYILSCSEFRQLFIFFWEDGGGHIAVKYGDYYGRTAVEYYDQEVALVPAHFVSLWSEVDAEWIIGREQGQSNLN